MGDRNDQVPSCQQHEFTGFCWFSVDVFPVLQELNVFAFILVLVTCASNTCWLVFVLSQMKNYHHCLSTYA